MILSVLRKRSLVSIVQKRNIVLCFLHYSHLIYFVNLPSVLYPSHIYFLSAFFLVTSYVLMYAICVFDVFEISCKLNFCAVMKPRWMTVMSGLTPPRRLSSYDDGKENAAHPHMMICRLRRNACIEERCQKGKEDLSQASFKYTHFAVAGKSSYEDEWRSLRHHHMVISDAKGLMNNQKFFA